MRSPHSPRLAIIDFAKGACIILVVLGHATMWSEHTFYGDSSVGPWPDISRALAPLRMPMFFLISGIFARNKLHAPLGESFSKTTGLFILFALWATIYLIKLGIPIARDGMPYPDPLAAGLTLVLPSGDWYLWALATYYLIGWALVRSPIIVQRAAWLVFVVLALAYRPIEAVTLQFFEPPLQPLMLGSWGQNLIWFYMGSRASGPWLARMQQPRPREAALAVVCYATALAVLWRYDLDAELRALLAPLALWAGTTLLGLAPVRHWFIRGFAAVGRQTLPVYLLGTHVLSLFTLFVKLSPDSLAESPWLRTVTAAVLLPPVTTALVVLISLEIGRQVARTPFAFMLEPLKRLPALSDVRRAAARLARYRLVRRAPGTRS